MSTSPPPIVLVEQTIYAGMMGTIPSDVRSGLLELFYGVYQKDPDRCIDALTAMGVLVPGGDRLSIRRTAEFFLNNFQVPHCDGLIVAATKLCMCCSLLLSFLHEGA